MVPYQILISVQQIMQWKEFGPFAGDIETSLETIHSAYFASGTRIRNSSNFCRLDVVLADCVITLDDYTTFPLRLIALG